MIEAWGGIDVDDRVQPEPGRCDRQRAERGRVRLEHVSCVAVGDSRTVGNRKSLVVRYA